MAEYQCPKCHSGRVENAYPTIRCLSCGYSESLIDTPLAYGQHRALMVDAGRRDPGPDAMPEPVAPTPASLDYPEIERRFNDLQAQIMRLRAPTFEKANKAKPTKKTGIQI